MKKFLCAAWIVFALGSISCCAASADEALADSMAPGTWTANPRYMTFGEYSGHALKWRVLEVYDDKTAFLVLDDVLRDTYGVAYSSCFDRPLSPQTNDFPNSEIVGFLNGAFLNNLDPYRNGMLDTSYGPDKTPQDGDCNTRWYGAYQTGNSKIFLLGIGEARKYFIDGDTLDAAADRRVGIGYSYWLRSPGFDDDLAAFVRSDGSVDYYGTIVVNAMAVRPALKINLSSAVFTSALVSYP